MRCGWRGVGCGEKQSTLLYCIVLYCTALYCMYCTVLYCTVLYCTVLHYAMSRLFRYYIMLHRHCTILIRTLLYSAILLHYSFLYYSIHYITLLFTILQVSLAGPLLDTLPDEDLPARFGKVIYYSTTTLILAIT